MRTVTLPAPDDFDAWRDAARALAAADVPADQLVWQVGGGERDLFADAAAPPPVPGGRALSVPRAFIDLMRSALLHAEPQRFALGYTLLTRLRDQPGLMEDRADPLTRLRDQPGLMEDRADPLLRRLDELARQVRRDIHKMRAFLRFREVPEGDASRYVAWYEPEHHIVRHNAAFFVERFTGMRWSILTPAMAIHWDGAALTEGPGAARGDAPEGDPTEEVWKTYYASIFNPARVKIGAMLKEMPKKYWRNMPETALVPALIAGAQARESGMIATAQDKGEAALAAARTTPDAGGNLQAAWDALRAEALHCTRCHLYRPATQTVFGEGPLGATMMFVGEQPGDQEDLAGHPFVGPAGQVFDQALERAGIDRAETYVTNAVKHFKFEQRGKRRIHSKPDAGEIEACRWWIEQEQALLKPRITVALGATAARSLFGRTMTIGRERGRALDLPGGAGQAWITVHPSYLLRLPDAAAKQVEFGRFVDDLKAAHALVAG